MQGVALYVTCFETLQVYLVRRTSRLQSVRSTWRVMRTG